MSAVSEHTFDPVELLHELRCHTSGWVRARLDEVVRHQRALKVEELLLRKVLDEHGEVDLREDALRSEHNDAPRTARQNLEMARRLEALPEIATVAHAGDLSLDQLKPLVEIATAETDAHWAQRAPNWSPVDLERKARQLRGVTEEEAAARQKARAFKMWWRRDTGMLALSGELPDVQGALVKRVFDRMIEGMRPAKGEKWDTRAHRGADALVELCTNHADRKPGKIRAHITMHVPPAGPAEVDGVAISEATLARLADDATIAAVTVDEGQLWGARTDTDDIPEATKRFVRARDQHCRVGTCDETDCDIHHLVPRCEDGSNDAENLVLAGRPCGHHKMLWPNGPWILEGDPSQPDGLRLVHRDALARAP